MPEKLVRLQNSTAEINLFDVGDLLSHALEESDLDIHYDGKFFWVVEDDN